MEKRMLLAIVLMVAVIFLTNILFPPPPAPQQTATGPDTAAEVAGRPADGRDAAADRGQGREPRGAVAPDTDAGGAAGQPDAGAAGQPDAGAAGQPDAGAELPAAGAATEAGDGPLARAPDRPLPADTVVVRSPLYEYRFSTRGAALVGARLLEYASFVPNGAGQEPVELLRAGDRVLGFRLALGGDTVSLQERAFEPSRTVLELGPDAPRDSVSFRYTFPQISGGQELSFVLTYTFEPDRYLFHVRGRIEGLGSRGYSLLTSLGDGLRTNEANPQEDLGQLAFVVNGRAGGIRSRDLGDIEPDERVTPEGGPFTWVAVKSKYFLVAYLSPPEEPAFGGLVATGRAGDEPTAHMFASLPVPAGSGGFRFDAYVGPQEYDRLEAVGQDLESVNPYGWRWLRPILRPLVGIVMLVLTWMHETLSLTYGWVLILFGVLMRVVLFPLYQKSMRSQMAQMQVQPLMKEIQAKHKDDPQALQREMIRLYKEHNINPVAGCLPMLLPMPVLFTLFFVFQGTIEFRGVPFLWLPDLSLKDPLYIIPIVMGLSMFLLQWIGQRGVESNTQMKMMSYGMPLVFTFMFLNFPSGLNLYYATSNLASLPQQLYLSRERRAAQARQGAAVDAREAKARG